MDIMEKAKKVYEDLIAYFEEKNWNYTKYDDQLALRSGMIGEDLPMDFLLIVIPQNECVALYSPMPLKVPEDKKVDFALAVCVANKGVAQGNFDFDIESGDLAYRAMTIYGDSTISSDVFEKLLMIGMHTIDDYNDQFLMLSMGAITLDKFVELDKKRKGN